MKMKKRNNPEVQKRWREANRDKTRAASKRHYRKHIERERLRRREWWEKNPHKSKEYYEKHKDKLLAKDKLECASASLESKRDSHYRTHYGINYKEWCHLFTQQSSKCACCGSIESHNKNGWHTDHNHVSGKVRGIVCHFCNRGGGKHADNAEYAYKRWQYLLHHETLIQTWLFEYRKLHGDPVLNYKKTKCVTCKDRGIICDLCKESAHVDED